MFSFLVESLGGLFLDVLGIFHGRTVTWLGISALGVIFVHVLLLPIGIAIAIDVAWVALFTAFWHFAVGWRRTM